MPRIIAESIVAGGYDWPTPLDWQRQCQWMREKITEAIQAERDARPPKGHVLTDDGVARRVLGELPVTADGCVIGRRVSVFSVYWSYPGSDVAEVCYDSELWRVHGPRTQSFDASTCYSTREAAEAAKNKETT